MASSAIARILSPSLRPSSFLITRHLSTLASPTPIATLPGPTSPSPPVVGGGLDLSDTERLFSRTRTTHLLRSLSILHAISVDPLVDAGMKVMRSSAVMESRALRAAVVGALKRTVYPHFCAGEGAAEAAATVRELSGRGLKGILDYGSEDAEEGEACDRNLKGFLGMVEMAASPAVPESAVSFACVKITAICPISLLERMSDLLRWEKKDPSFRLPWKSHSMPLLSQSSPLYQTPSTPTPLTEPEEHDLRLALQRLRTLCQRCAEINLPILIDAEYTSVQPAIDYFTYSAALEFNRGDDPLVFGTIQAYLQDAKERLVQAVDAAEGEGIRFGFKLVRGAYMTRETELATSLGVASPIHRSIQDTHACYDDCASFMLEKVSRGSGSLVLATHNLESGKAAAAKAEELGIGKRNQKLQFSQLMGMADGLSLGLRNAGFQVSKYLPFGPVDQVIPYLLRRAEENRGLLSASSHDKELIRKELRRRMKTAVLGVA
ncbi:proline dehydrogenase 2, mitochondrial-like [Iris pallida]|uniref:Proline dehydrogenase n=1 Tax=Iris pallida TaxID=29817 RepID=A0AAX6HJ47_IRIPA|nr:proline dehydrogenase 2, mitochondrial-like [Iris pallida]